MRVWAALLASIAGGGGLWRSRWLDRSLSAGFLRTNGFDPNSSKTIDSVRCFTSFARARRCL